MTHLRHSWLALAILLTGCGGTGAVATGAPVAAPAASDSPTATAVTIIGSRTANSERFTLGGNYSVTLSAKVQGDSQGCYTASSLKRVDGSTFFESLPDGDATAGAPATGTTILYNLASAEYYVDANSGCDWSYTFTPN